MEPGVRWLGGGARSGGLDGKDSYVVPEKDPLTRTVLLGRPLEEQAAHGSDGDKPPVFLVFFAFAPV